MSDIPNPIGSFEIFAPKKVKALKANKPNRLQRLTKKIAKKLFGKKFATKTRAELRTLDVVPSTQIDKVKKPAFKIVWASTPGEIKEAQRLRYKVFAEEMGANLPATANGLDIDEFDAYCDHY